MVDKNLWREGAQDKGFLAGTILCGTLSGLLGALQALVLAHIIARACTGTASLASLGFPLGLLLAAILGRAAMNWLEEHLALRLAGGVQQRLRHAVLCKMENLGPVRMRKEQHGALMTLLTEGLDTLEVYFQKYLPQLFKSAIIPVVFLLLVFPFDWATGLILLITAPLVPVFMALIGSWTKQQTKRQWKVLARMGGYFQDVLEGLATLKLFNRSAEQREKIDEVSEDFRKVNLRVLKWAFLSALVLELLTTVSIALIAVGLGLRLVYGQIDFSVALFLLFLAPDYYLPLRSLGTQYHNSLNGAEAAKELFAFLALPERENNNAGGASAPSSNASLEFCNVGFAYEQGRPALRGVNLRLAPGERLGIVGPSGSGKSTLLHLAAGFLQPDTGELLLGGIPLGATPATQPGRCFALVPQDPYLFQGSILDNIRLGNPGSTDDEVKKLCRTIGAEDFIQGLPQGYATPVGQGGQGLSGGERQLLAIARACLKNAPIILLDEATKNLDWRTDRQVQKALAHLTREHSVIAVAHRLQTVADMDHILVLDAGLVVEQGTPAELRRRGGPFAQMLEMHGTPPPQETPSAAPVAPLQEVPTGNSAAGPPSAKEGPAQPDAAGRNTRSALADMLRMCLPFKGRMVGAAGIGAAAVLFNAALLGFSAYLISWASQMPPVMELSAIIVAVRFFGIGRAILRYLERYVSHDVTFRILKKLRIWYYDQMEKLSYLSLQKLGMGRVFKHIINDVDTLKFFYLRVLTVPLVALLVLAATNLFLGTFHWALTGIVTAFFLLGGVIIPVLYRRLFHRRRAQASALKQRYSELLYDYIQGLGDATIYGATETMRSQIELVGAEMAAERRRVGAWDGFAQVSSALLANLALWASLLVLIPMVQGQWNTLPGAGITPGGALPGIFLAAVVWVAWAAFEALQPTAAAAEYLEQSRSALAGMADAAARPREPRRSGAAWLPPNGGLCVKHLSYAYENDHPVLNDISFQLAPGGKAAIVGTSGAGKSTLLNLLIGFLDYQQGSITSGGVEFRDVSANTLRRQIGYLEQHPYLFHASIRENILIAKQGATEEEMLRAARLAQLDDFVAALPDGYDTQIGENGYRLSAGQRQRLALARLFLQDAPIVVLDEPTQNLDNANREALLASLQAWWPQKTVLYITHDLAGLETMDQVLVLEEGRIIEAGTQVTLIHVGGAYARLHTLERDYF